MDCFSLDEEMYTASRYSFGLPDYFVHTNMNTDDVRLNMPVFIYNTREALTMPVHKQQF